MPGCTLDEKAGREATAAAPGKQSQVWTTSDSFDKVYAFYKGLYKEYTMRHGGPKLASGQQVQWAFFILDGSKDLASSGYWMKIQSPLYRSRWFRVANGQAVRFYATNGRRLVLLPPKGAGLAVLLEARKSEELVAEIRRE